MARYPYNNEEWTQAYRAFRDQGRGHEAAVNGADRWLTNRREDRGDKRPVFTDPRGIAQRRPDYGTLLPGFGLTGSPITEEAKGRGYSTGGGRGAGAQAAPDAGQDGGIRAAIVQQTGGLSVMERLQRRRMGGTGAGAQAIADRRPDADRGAAAGGMTGPGAQARTARRAERRAGIGAGGMAVQMPGLARVREIGAALRARRAEVAQRRDVEELADELAEAIEAGDIGAADIPTAAAETGAAGAELLASLAAVRTVDPSAELADALAAIAEAAAGPASACTCSTSAPAQDDPMNLSPAQLATIASMLQGSGLAGLVAPQQGRFDRFALEARPTSYRLARSVGVAAGAAVNVTVATNKDIAAGSAIYVAAIDPATGAQFFDFALSNVVIAGDNIYAGPAGATDGPDLNPDGQTAPGFAVFSKIPSGTTITYTLTNNNGVAVNFLASVRAQATRAVAGIDGTCSA